MPFGTSSGESSRAGSISQSARMPHPFAPAPVDPNVELEAEFVQTGGAHVIADLLQYTEESAPSFLSAALFARLYRSKGGLALPSPLLQEFCHTAATVTPALLHRTVVASLATVPLPSPDALLHLETRRLLLTVAGALASTFGSSGQIPSCKSLCADALAAVENPCTPPMMLLAAYNAARCRLRLRELGAAHTPESPLCLTVLLEVPDEAAAEALWPKSEAASRGRDLLATMVEDLLWLTGHGAFGNPQYTLQAGPPAPLSVLLRVDLVDYTKSGVAFDYARRVAAHAIPSGAPLQLRAFKPVAGAPLSAAVLVASPLATLSGLEVECFDSDPVRSAQTPAAVLAHSLQQGLHVLQLPLVAEVLLPQSSSSGPVPNVAVPAPWDDSAPQPTLPREVIFMRIAARMIGDAMTPSVEGVQQDDAALRVRYPPYLAIPPSTRVLALSGAWLRTIVAVSPAAFGDEPGDTAVRLAALSVASALATDALPVATLVPTVHLAPPYDTCRVAQLVHGLQYIAAAAAFDPIVPAEPAAEPHADEAPVVDFQSVLRAEWRAVMDGLDPASWSFLATMFPPTSSATLAFQQDLPPATHTEASRNPIEWLDRPVDAKPLDLLPGAILAVGPWGEAAAARALQEAEELKQQQEREREHKERSKDKKKKADF